MNKHQLNNLIHQIVNWDKQHIHILKSLLDEMKEYDYPLGDKMQNYINFADLPTHPFPKDFSTSEVWAMDLAGFCLIGESMDSVKHIAEIIEDRERDYNERIARMEANRKARKFAEYQKLKEEFE